jgi:hypothetical protein
MAGYTDKNGKVHGHYGPTFIVAIDPGYSTGTTIVREDHVQTWISNQETLRIERLMQDLMDAAESLEDPEVQYVEIEGFGVIQRGDLPHLFKKYCQGGEVTSSTDPDLLRREAERMLQKALESVPRTDEFAVGQVLTFTKFFGGRDFDYAAIKAGDEKWYVTGSKVNASALPWNELIAFITAKNLLTIKVLDMQAGKNIKDYVEGVTKVLEGETK